MANAHGMLCIKHVQVLVGKMLPLNYKKKQNFTYCYI